MEDKASFKDILDQLLKSKKAYSETHDQLAKDLESHSNSQFYDFQLSPLKPKARAFQEYKKHPSPPAPPPQWELQIHKKDLGEGAQYAWNFMESLCDAPWKNSLSERELKGIYRNLARKFHPDMGSNQAETFMKVHQLHQVLLELFRKSPDSPTEKTAYAPAA